MNNAKYRSKAGTRRNNEINNSYLFLMLPTKYKDYP